MLQRAPLADAALCSVPRRPAEEQQAAAPTQRMTGLVPHSEGPCMHWLRLRQPLAVLIPFLTMCIFPAPAGMFHFVQHLVLKHWDSSETEMYGRARSQGLLWPLPFRRSNLRSIGYRERKPAVLM